nr:hypothetical protein [Pseudomonas sp. BIGb0427]
MPPLRERLEDLPALSEAILEELGSQHELDGEAQALLARHAWPGNIRELRNVLERATLLADQARLGLGDVQAALGDLAPLPVEAATLSYKQACADFERQLLENTLARCAGNVPQAARQLGLGRSTLYKETGGAGDQVSIKRYVFLF